MFDLTCGEARATVVPVMGGGLAGLWRGEVPALRPCADPGAAGPFDLALNILAPFSNRIGGGFDFEDRHHALAPNLPGEPFPIHGDAFQRGWEVGQRAADRATLHLAEGGIGPFRYSARLDYLLTAERLSAALELCNRGEVTLPFGCGFHPWFPRNAGTRLSFRATGWWPEDARHLPATAAAAALPPELTFDAPRPLPDGWINAGFAGWPGEATLMQGAGAVPLRITATGLSTAILYFPHRDAGFFCFEPVSHPVDAHNLPRQPGLVALAPGQTLACAMALTWS